MGPVVLDNHISDRDTRATLHRPGQSPFGQRGEYHKHAHGWGTNLGTPWRILSRASACSTDVRITHLNSQDRVHSAYGEGGLVELTWHLRLGTTTGTVGEGVR
jgi:hypothetical protein